MHLIQRYSLASSSKIGKPFILDKFYPLNTTKYISFQPYSKYNSKNYSRWNLVIDLLKPILDKENISVVQVGGPNEAPIKDCIHTQGTTSFGQLSYIVKNSLLHLGADSISNHLASGFTKIVGIYSNNWASVVKPYWSKNEDCTLIEPERGNLKPSFSAEENPKSIDTIRPEQIAAAVCKLLNLPFSFPYETLYFGDFYSGPFIVEMIPDLAINIASLNLESIVVRMDEQFNEDVLHNQMMVSPVSIITKQPINKDLIVKFKERIRQFFYIIDENNDPKYVDFLHKLGLNYVLFSYLSEEELNKYKIQYLDYNLIIRKDKVTKQSIKEIKDVDSDKLYYKTNKIRLAKQKIYPGKAAWLQDKDISNFNMDFLPIIDIPEFYEDNNFLWMLKKKD